MQWAGLGTGLVNAADKIYPKRSALVVVNIVWLPLAELFLRNANARTKRLKGKAY